MKRLILFLLIAKPVFGQWVVHDPANTAVNSAIQSAQVANHAEILKQWLAQLEGLNRQIQQLESQLAEQRRIREVLGNPTLAGAQMVLDRFSSDELARSYGESLREVRRLADVVSSLKRSADGIYAELNDATSVGQSFTRQASNYRRYAAVDRQAEQAGRVVDETAERQVALQTDLAVTLAALKTASTQAEVDKLSAKVAAINGQLAVIAAARRDQADLLQSQHIQNQNQAAKEAQDLLEKQITEERQSLKVINTWQRGVQIAPDTYSRP